MCKAMRRRLLQNIILKESVALQDLLIQIMVCKDDEECLQSFEKCMIQIQDRFMTA